jgi:hypothetical protein
MRSPFPGMNPYLEQFWGDVHHRLITYGSDSLQRLLPSDLRARVQERVFVESPAEDRNFFPDIRVVERGRIKRKARQNGSVALAEPVRIRMLEDPVSEGYIEILDMASGRRVVTVIEVLSPYNKAAGRGNRLYLKKQQECIRGGVNLVEIDLLRAGRWVLSIPQDLVKPSMRTSYKVCVLRAGAGHWDYYPAPLRERLPVIPVPLRKTDAEVPLDLQSLLEQAYRNGAYDDDIDYTREPVPPLAQDDARWAQELLQKKRRRPAPSKQRPKQPRQKRSP